MTIYYVDSSALVKQYVTETGSGWMQKLCNPAAGHILALAHVGIVEIAAALAAKCWHGVLPAPILTCKLRALTKHFPRCDPERAADRSLVGVIPYDQGFRCAGSASHCNSESFDCAQGKLL